jgi:hypothetical protein
VIGAASDNVAGMQLAALLFMGCGGDVYVLWRIRGLDGGDVVMSHETRVGCVALLNPERAE